MSAAIVSVNIGGIRKLRMPRGEVDSAIVKLPATVPVALRGNSLAGDEQANRKYHGGPDRAVYAYASEDYRWWEARLGRTLEPGTFGENLTTAGIDVNAALIGERWTIGRDAVLEISMPRVPCSRLAARMGDPAFVATFAQALRLGPYFRIVTHGDIAAATQSVLRRGPNMASGSSTRLRSTCSSANGWANFWLRRRSARSGPNGSFKGSVHAPLRNQPSHAGFRTVLSKKCVVL
ncbi:MAG: MOSC domain-containing protein [Candidatus Velthaea sp.]